MKKKLFQFVLLIVALTTVLATSGCDEWYCDGSAGEPVFLIVYNAGGNVNQVYAEVNGSALPPVAGAQGTQFSLPIDLNNNSVTYVFQTTQGNKKMQVFYENSSDLESFDCGFRFSIKNPIIGSSDFTNPVISGGDFENYQITIQ